MQINITKTLRKLTSDFHKFYLYRHTEEEGEKVHDGEAWENLFLQKHSGVVVVAVLCCGVVMM